MADGLQRLAQARRRLALAVSWQRRGCAGWAALAERACHLVPEPSVALATRAASERSAAAMSALRALRRSPGAEALQAHAAALQLAPACDDSLSRSLTIWLALWRLGLLPRRCSAEAPLRVLILGAQAHKEGASPEQTALVFQALRRLLGHSGVEELHLLLCGPEVGRATAPPAAAPDPAGAEDQPACALTVEYVRGLWHEAAAAAPAARATADAVVCFQPGVWGYSSWRPTIELALQTGAPLLITSYSWEEADDDCGALEDWGLPPRAWVWELEANPYAAAMPEAVLREQPALTADSSPQDSGAQEDPKGETANGAGELALGARLLRDNHHWQCMRHTGPWLTGSACREEAGA